MRLADARDAYYTASGTASTIARQLGLAAIGIIWLLSGGFSESRIRLTVLLLWSSLLVLSSLFFDLLQYLWTAAAFAVWARTKEKALDATAAVETDRSVLGAPPGRVPRLARMLHYPPIPPEPRETPAGNEREIGGTPDAILATTWWLFAIKIGFVIASYVLIAVSLVRRITIG